MPNGTVICTLEDLSDGTSRGFALPGPAGQIDLLLVRRGHAIFAYENHCPHKGTPLDWVPGHFLSADGSHIVCATHGAQFRIEDGYCFGGPCAGGRLRTVSVAVRNGAVVVTG
jgi:nitrite reductase/ring-hydroxylating ferredoxin subunit